MLSIPPAIIVSALPACIRSFASMIDFMPEPHTLLMVVAPQESGIPEFLIACLAGACLRPAPTTFPKITSLISDFSMAACSMEALIAWAPSCGADSEDREP